MRVTAHLRHDRRERTFSARNQIRTVKGEGHEDGGDQHALCRRPNASAIGSFRGYFRSAPTLEICDPIFNAVDPDFNLVKPVALLAHSGFDLDEAAVHFR